MAYGQEPDRATTFSITRSRSFMKGTHAVILRCSVFLDKVPAPTRPLITPQKSVTHEEAMEDSVQCRVLQEVGNDQPVMGDGPRTISGKCPTAASLQLQREYLDWSAVPQELWAESNRTVLEGGGLTHWHVYCDTCEETCVLCDECDCDAANSACASCRFTFG